MASASGETAAAFLRLSRDLPGFLATPHTIHDVRVRLRADLATRSQRFLALVDRAIYGHPGSPYLALLREAGCELGDVAALVDREGIDSALRILAGRGVYVTDDEFKGRRPAVRGSRTFTFRDEDFDNPLVRPHLIRFTGGSTGRPSRVRVGLPLVDAVSASLRLALDAHGFGAARQAFWWPLPIAHMLYAAKLGQPSVGWFYPVHPLPRAALTVARATALVSRVAGYRLPPPRRCDLADPAPLVRWLGRLLADGQPLSLYTMTGAATRLAIAASEAGQSLRGLMLHVSSEPLTPARRRHIEAAGARVMVNYSSVELSAVAYSCAAPQAVDDVHIMLDRYAVVTRRRATVPGGPAVDALLFSTLTPSAQKIALNTELGDEAVVEERDCDCLLGSLGLRTHLSEIRSFGKLTGEGVTFARSNLEQFVEVILPARFGGTSMDYQITEEENASGTARLVLRVHPTVGPLDEAAARAALLAYLRQAGPVEQYQAALWEQAGTIEVRREPPNASCVGKVPPVRVVRTEDGAGPAR